jgi:APA family basic amino acid/polyamine antiporter
MLIASSRLVYGMAKSGSLPGRFATVHRTRRTPGIAIAVVIGVSLVFLLLGDIREDAQITNFTLYVTFLVINAAVIALRLHSPQLHRPFRVPVSLAGIPVTPILGALVCVFFLFQLTLYTLLIGSALLAITLGISYLTLQKKN